MEKGMEVKDLVAYIKNSGQHQHLYHFTDQTNLQSIAGRGLLSKEQMREEGWWPPPATGGNELSRRLDTENGIDSYVSLCFTQDHGMAYRAKNDGRLPNLLYLAISPEVLEIAGARIALGVANATDVGILPVSEAIGRLDLEVLYTRTDWHDPDIQRRLQAAKKYEVLIPIWCAEKIDCKAGSLTWQCGRSSSLYTVAPD